MIEDHSTTNPKLHELYVKWAMIHLSVVNEFIIVMDNFSNWNASQLMMPVWHARKELIDTNMAYRDAAARIMAGHPIPEMDETLND